MDILQKLQKNSKYIGYAGCILMLLGNFLAFATVTVSLFGFSESESISFIDGDGKFVLVAAIVTAVLLYLKKEKLSLIPTGIALAITVYDAINVSDTAGSTLGMGEVSLGIGFWVIMIGIVLAAGSVVLDHLKNKNNPVEVKETSSETDEETKFCQSCGSKVKVNSKFCNNCGKEIW